MAGIGLIAVGRQLFGGSFVVDADSNLFPVQSTNREEATRFLSQRLPTLYRSHEGHRLSLETDCSNTFVYCRSCRRFVYTDVKE